MLVRNLLYIACGGAIGAVSRFSIGLFMTSVYGPSFPFGTLVVNVLGSFLMGCCAAYFSFVHGTTHPLALFIMIGFLGAFTTFSSFSLETLNLILNAQPLVALSNVIINVVVCIIAVTAGMFLVKYFY